MSNEQLIDGLDGMTREQQRHFLRSRRMLTRFPQPPASSAERTEPPSASPEAASAGPCKGPPSGCCRTRAGVERVVARELTDLERGELWPRLLKHHPIWGACQSCTDRQIALVALERQQHQKFA